MLARYRVDFGTLREMQRHGHLAIEGLFRACAMNQAQGCVAQLSGVSAGTRILLPSHPRHNVHLLGITLLKSSILIRLTITGD